MNPRKVLTMLAAAVCFSALLPSYARDQKSAVIKARYKPVEGTDIEYGQGAIERNELPHREIAPLVWLLKVPVPPDLPHWQKKLNDAVDPKHGSFTVEYPTTDEQRRVESGEITFQQ